jgi:23S rRNA (cytosine1962-C5)-methyltransferase
MTDLITTGWNEYRLLDSGQGRKLEKFGPYVIDRPEEQAMWNRRLPAEQWTNADAVFAGQNEAEDGRWNYRKPLPETWQTGYGPVKFLGRFTPFRHVGYFPEQAPHWDFMTDRIKGRKDSKILNLFAYTGVASLLAAQAGAQVTHLDASKKAMGWAAENQKISGLETAPIRWICEDARKFTAREGRRGNKYHGILVDPPKFGRGTNKEVWNLFDDLKEMLEQCNAVLDEKDGFLILTTYAVRASHYALFELCGDIFKGCKIESGELVIQEENQGRKISTSLYCRVMR